MTGEEGRERGIKISIRGAGKMVDGQSACFASVKS